MKSAVLSRQSGANRLPHVPNASAARICVLSKPRLDAIRREFTEARPIPSLARLISENQVSNTRRNTAEQIQRAVAVLFSHAEREEWSRRELEQRIGISRRTLLRLQRGQADALTWLPKLETALAKINPS